MADLGSDRFVKTNTHVKAQLQRSFGGTKLTKSLCEAFEVVQNTAKELVGVGDRSYGG
jgi:hypothetical protein